MRWLGKDAVSQKSGEFGNDAWVGCSPHPPAPVLGGTPLPRASPLPSPRKKGGSGLADSVPTNSVCPISLIRIAQACGCLEMRGGDFECVSACRVNESSTCAMITQTAFKTGKCGQKNAGRGGGGD